MRRIRFIGKNGRLYTSLVLSITLCIVVTLLTSSYVNYKSFTDFALNRAYQADLNSLNRTSKEVAGMTDSAQSLSFQIYRNSTISKLLYYTEPNIYDVTAGMAEISNYLNSMPFIESILVYNSASDVFYVAARSGQNGIFSRNELADKDILNILQRFKEYQPFTPIPRTYHNDTGVSETISAYSYLCYDAINRSNTINSAVVVNISASWINQGIATEGEQKGQTYIIDNHNRILSSSTLLPADLSTKEAELIRKAIADNVSSYRLDTFRNDKSLISYTKKDSLNWQYVKVTPYHSIVETIGSIRNTTITIAIIILLAGLLISWLVSGIMYIPIRRIINKVNLLETEKRNHSQTIKQNALRGLLLGTRSPTNKRKLDSLTSIGITFSFHQDYRVVLLKIDRFQELKTERSGDLPTYKYAIMNISSEIMSEVYQVETVDMDDDSIVVLLNLPEAPTPVEDKVFLDRILQAQSAIQDFLSISVSIAYSPATNEPLHLHPLYEQVKEAALHRVFYGRGCLIDSEDILELKSKEYIFPMDKEKRLSEAVKVGRMDEAMELFTEIVQETSQYPIHVMRLAISHLSMSINNLIYSIQKNGAVEFRGGFDIYMPTLDSIETAAELTTSFQAFLDEVRSKLVEKRTMKQENLVLSIDQLIQTHYADPNLSVNWIAEQLDMSSLYVSRIYKQQTLRAIVDVINDCRLEKSKELLEKSSSSIADITEKIGYTSSSYFHRMFKKHCGVTPTEYRKAMAGSNR